MKKAFQYIPGHIIYHSDLKADQLVKISVAERAINSGRSCTQAGEMLYRAYYDVVWDVACEHLGFTNVVCSMARFYAYKSIHAKD